MADPNAPFDLAETVPADTAPASGFPAAERMFRDAVEKWLKVNHDADTGYLTAGRMIPQTSAPSLGTTTGGVFYVKSVAGVAEAFYSDGTNDLQLTKNGALNIASAPDPTFTALTYAAAQTWDVAANPKATLILTGNVASLAVSNAADGKVYVLRITQDATGDRTFAFPANWVWPDGGNVPELTSDANAVDILTVLCVGSTYYAALARDWQ